MYNNSKPCCFESKPPYVCNGCKRMRYTYNHAVAYNEYKKGLINSRKQVYITKEQVASINDVIAPYKKLFIMKIFKYT